MSSIQLINIEKKIGEDKVAINPQAISSIYADGDSVVVRLACGWGLITKFTDVESATDYINKALDSNVVLR